MTEVSRDDADRNPQYWDDYNNFQHTKHSLIHLYLGGWFNILGTTSGRIIYFDTHAGRGKYATGDAGSPLVALQTLLTHQSRDAILKNCEVVFYFVERDPDNYDSLVREIAGLGELPRGVVVKPLRENSYEVLKEILADLKSRHGSLAPSFVFVDPYSHVIPGALLKELMSYPKVELFVTLMWRELDMRMHITSQPNVESEIESLLLGPGAREIAAVIDDDERAHRTIDLLRGRIGARWATPIFMLHDRSAIRYILLHLTNHERGRELIKEKLWKACPAAGGPYGFFARKSEDHHQLQLIEDQPDLRPLEDWLIERLRRTPTKLHALYPELISTMWTKAQLNQVVSDLRKQKRINTSLGAANPFLTASGRA